MGLSSPPNTLSRSKCGAEIDEATDPEARREELTEEFREQFANPYGPARRGYVDDVIEPGETRQRLIADLDSITHRPPTYSEKVHDNVPL